jgi:DNA-binding beta-propeller fold protein YncE
MIPHRVAFPRRTAALLAALLLTATLPLGAQPPEKKAVPDNATLGQAEATILDLFGPAFKDAKTDKNAAQKLAGHLLARSLATDDDDGLRYMGLKMASELAARAGDNATALEAVEELAKGFKVDTLDVKTDIYAQVEKNTATPEEAIALTEAVLYLVEEALNADNFAAADRLMATAAKAAQKSQKLFLHTKVERRTQEVADARKAFDHIKPFLAKIADGDKDPEVSLQVGKYYCFAKGKYELGLPLLARGDDEPLKKLATRDLAGPAKGRAQADLAHDWYQLAKMEKGLAQRQMLRRALHWYQRSLPEVRGLTQDRVQQRVEELAALFPSGSGSAALTSDIVAEVRKISPAHNGGVLAVTVSQDGKLILSSSSQDSSVRLWDAATGQKKLDLTGNGTTECVAISPDKKFALTGARDNTMRLWSLETGKEVRRFNGHNDYVRAVHFLPGGQKVLSACDDKVIRIFDLNTGNLLKSLPGHGHYINGLAISKDGKRAVSASLDKSVRVWDLDTGVEVRKWFHGRSVAHVALSPDGKRAVTTSFDNTVKIWDVDAGKELRTLPHPGMVWQVLIAPDGRRVYTACGGGLGQDDSSVVFSGNNNQVRVFDLNSGKELRVLAGHTEYVRTLAMTADGRMLVTGSNDGSVRVWGAK